MPQAPPYLLHVQFEVIPPTTVQTKVPEDTHTCIDHIEQRIRQFRISNSSIVWDDFDSISVVSLSTKFKMPDIARYTDVGYPYIHLRLYITIMRAHGLDESQMITMFPLFLSGIAQRWFASLEFSRCRTWDDLAQEFLR